MKGEDKHGILAHCSYCRRKVVVRLLNRVKTQLVFVILCMVLLTANIGILHRFSCANDDISFHVMDNAINELTYPRQTRAQVLRRNDELVVTTKPQPSVRPPVVTERDDKGDKMSQIEFSPNVDSMSACLLIKDDNDILNEWLAYHYHAIKLRYLVVAIDPSSEESPKDILARWQNKTDLSILVWSDSDFMPTHFLQTGYHKAPHEIDGDAKRSKWHEGHENPEQVIADNLKILNHRYRQVTFLSKCLGHLKKQGKKWAVHVDTDEYVVVNPLLRNSTIDKVRWPQIRDIRKPSSIFEIIQELDLHQKIKYPCISMPRLLFGSIEHQVAPHTYLHLNSTLLETTRWLYHTRFDDKERNAQPKVIIDVSAVSEKDEMFRKPFSIHRPSRRLCRGISEVKFSLLQSYPITVNHYTGSWERYNSKNDSRRSRRVYEMKAFVQDGYDNWITPWLDGFIETNGLNLTMELLADYVLHYG